MYWWHVKMTIIHLDQDRGAKYDLNCNTHIQNMTIKANRTLGFIRRNVSNVHTLITWRHTSNSIQHTSTAPACVCLPFMEPIHSVQYNKMEAVQGKAAHWVTNDYSLYSNVTQLINSLGRRSLEQRRVSSDRNKPEKATCPGGNLKLKSTCPPKV